MSYLSNVNYLYSTWMDASNSIPNGTYGNVSLLTLGKGQIGNLTTGSIGLNCDSPSSYVLDASGAVRIRDNLDISGNINSAFLDASLNLRALDSQVVKTSGIQNIAGAKTFTETTTFNGTIVGMTAMRMSGGQVQTSGGLYYPSTNFNRKIVLAPVANNEYQNYSIGTNVSNKLIQFLVPDDTGHFVFSNANDTTSKSDILDISPPAITAYTEFGVSNGTTTSIVLTQNDGLRIYDEAIYLFNTGQERIRIDSFQEEIDISGIALIIRGGLSFTTFNASNQRVVEWDDDTLDVSNTVIQMTGMKIHNCPTGAINGATTITKPWAQYRAVESQATAYTITLPTITINDLGKEITFRKVRASAGAATISFIGNGTQWVYDSQLVGGATAQGIMTSGVATVRLVCLPDTGNGAYAWFRC